MSDSQSRSVFTDFVNRGGCTYAENKWLECVTDMYILFNEHHPKDSLRSGPGVVRNFQKLLVENTKFFLYHEKILGFIAR